MNRKSRFLVALSALTLLGAAPPSFAQDSGGGERGVQSRQLPGRVGARAGEGGQRGENRQWQGGGQGGQRDQGQRDRGQRDQGQRDQGQRDQGQRDQGRRDFGQGQGDGQRQWRSDERRGDDDRQWQGRNRQADNRNWRNDDRGQDNRDWNNGRRNDNRFGGWDGRSNFGGDYRRYEPNRRAYAAIPYGRYFGRSYGSIASRYYNRNYIYYGARSWPSWSRPWRVGYALPYSMRCSQLPYDLYYALPPPPYGYDYVMCGYDILLVGYESRIVIDAILPW